MHGLRNLKISERLEKPALGCSFWNTLPNGPVWEAASSATAQRWTVSGSSQGQLTSRTQCHSCDPGTRKALHSYCEHLSSLKMLGAGQRTGLYPRASSSPRVSI